MNGGINTAQSALTASWGGIEMEFAPLLPLWGIILLAGLAALPAFYALWRRQKGAFWRLLAVLVVGLALLSPQGLRIERAALPGLVLLAEDASASQSLGPRPQQRNAAAQALEAALRARGFEVRRISVTETAEGTKLFAGIETALDTLPTGQLAGIVAITDGQIADTPRKGGYGPLSGAGAAQVPFHALITGVPGEQDRWLEVVEAPAFALVGQAAHVKLRVRAQTGERRAFSPRKDSLERGKMALQIRQNGQAQAVLAVQAGQEVEVPVVLDRAGVNAFEFMLEAGENELTTRNNRAFVAIRGVRDALNVLLVSGEPHAGQRTWRHILKGDPNVSLVHFTILRPQDKQDATPINELSLIAFPTRDLFIDKIDKFDLILLDRYSGQSVLPSAYFENMVRYVRAGGAILLSGGPELAQGPGPSRLPFGAGLGGMAAGAAVAGTHPLAAILPVEGLAPAREGAFVPQRSPTGRKHPITRLLPGAEAGAGSEAGTGDLPWGPWFRYVPARTKATGISVLDAPEGAPLLVVAHEGKGRVGLLLSDQLWLWARGYAGGGPYEPLLRRLVHWLMKEPELDEERLDLRLEAGMLVAERQTLGAGAGDFKLTLPDGAVRMLPPQEVQPGLWRAQTPFEQSGFHGLEQRKGLEQGALQAAFLIGEDSAEWRAVVSDPAAMAQLLAGMPHSVQRLQDEAGTLRLPEIFAATDAQALGARLAEAAQNQARQISAGEAAFLSPLQPLGFVAGQLSEVRAIERFWLLIGLPGLFALLAFVLLAWWREGRGQAS